MSIIVKGEPMPEACAFCPCFRDDSIDGVHAYQCKATFITYGKEDDWIWNTRPNWCPLVELPEKHGRLIDAEALIDTLEQAIAIMETMLKQLDLEADDGCLMELKAYRDIRDGIKEIDAVIEAEGEEK